MSGLFVRKGGLPKPATKHSQPKINVSLNPRLYRQIFGEIAPERPQARPTIAKK